MKSFQEFKQFGLTASDEQHVIGGTYCGGRRSRSYSYCNYGSCSYSSCYSGSNYSNCCYGSSCYSNYCGTSDVVESTPEPTPVPEVSRNVLGEGGGA